uniref:LytR/AlgR family response regulator transcription factor n=1 Tax=Agathobacter sp. TaxID=2021311 RepID=UPI0040577BAB
MFLDIYMAGISGMETATKLRTFDANCLLIFTTTSTDHALEGLRVRAMHYLVKLYAEDDLSALIDEILLRLPKPDPADLYEFSVSERILLTKNILRPILELSVIMPGVCLAYLPVKSYLEQKHSP